MPYVLALHSSLVRAALLLITAQFIWSSSQVLAQTAQIGGGASMVSTIRATLMDQPRWMMEWHAIDTPSERSTAETRFEVVDGKILAHFNSPVFGRCTRQVTLADDGFGFPGCWSGLPHALKYDPNDPGTPFKERRGHRLYILRPLK